MDVGENTGKFTLKCMVYDPEGYLELPGQLAMAKENVGQTTYSERVNYFPINILDESQKFPNGADTIWICSMSRLLQ